MKHLAQGWKVEALLIFKSILKQCEKDEDYENCARLKENIDYLEAFQLAPNQTEFPHPYETIEDDESIFIRFLPQDSMIDQYLKVIDKESKNNNKKKRK